MSRSGFARLILAIATLASSLLAQEHPGLQVQLRSATGSNRFQIGEVIPLEVVLSSNTPNRYLEPCALFRESNFGFPMCRFSNKWSFTITPEDGWVDLTKELPSGPGTFGGPSFEVPDHDLSSKSEVFPYLLTHRFRFDRAGEYHVKLSLEIGLDDESTQRNRAPDPSIKPHSVTVAPEIALQIVLASEDWQREIIRNGSEAYSKPIPHNSDPPSPEFLRYQQDTQALCNLGTPEAARVLIGLLSSQHQEIRDCLDHTPSTDAAIKEMQRALVDPNAAVSPELFSELRNLLAKVDFKAGGLHDPSLPTFEREREIVIDNLPRKHGEALATTLLTVLGYPPRAKGTPFDSGYDIPFDHKVIAAVVANYDGFPSQSREWLLGDAWARVNSPLMLPLVRRLAEAGKGQALLRWMELDSASATAFERKEVVRPVPRFSSFYLRLPESSLPEQEVQLAANLIRLTQNQDLFNGATLLHRYATSAVLPVVLPFIAAKHPWPLSVQFPMLAYLLKVSPTDAKPRIEELLLKINHEPWQSTFFTDIGFLGPGPVLERLAMAQIETGTQPLASDAIDYLRLHGSVKAKPFIWQQLVHWHEQLVASETAKGATEEDRVPINNKYSVLVTVLTSAFVRAQGWVVSPDDSDRMQALLGKQSVAGLSCSFSCGTPISIGPSPAIYAIYGRANSSRLQNERPEYMNPTERLYYSINQYRCADMRALKEKILQFPAGSSFDFAYDFSAADRDELVEVSDFLWSHGYKVRNPQKWDFLRPAFIYPETGFQEVRRL